jgi:hypothetical protein
MVAFQTTLLTDIPDMIGLKSGTATAEISTSRAA